MLEWMVDCVSKNFDWIFSGIGVFVLGLFFVNKKISKKCRINQKVCGNNNVVIGIKNEFGRIEND